MLLMNNTRHLLISFQRTISVFYVADSDGCTSLHFCSNRLHREMSIKIMFPTKKKTRVAYLQKIKKPFFQIYWWSIVTDKWYCYGIIIIDFIEKSELCENFKSTVILSSSFFRTSAIWKLEMSFPTNIKYHA